MGEPMTEAEARAVIAAWTWAAMDRPATNAQAHQAVAAVLDRQMLDALAVLLDPETMLRAWEKAGRVAPGIIGNWWRIVPDEEGAT